MYNRWLLYYILFINRVKVISFTSKIHLSFSSLVGNFDTRSLNYTYLNSFDIWKQAHVTDVIKNPVGNGTYIVKMI